MDVWLTSDTHFDHINIIKYEGRPFYDQHEMTEKLIENWNEVVKPNDLIIHCGDVFFCNTKKMEYISSRLNGRKILVRGNHDNRISNSKFRKLGFNVYKYYYFQDLLISHYPQNEITLKTAIKNTDLIGNVHGHVHSNISDLDQSIYKCVSVEQTDYKPIHVYEVFDHFYSDGDWIERKIESDWLIF